MAARGVDKVIDKLRDRIGQGSYYEAQQSYKASFYRFKAKQQLDDACRLLQDGAEQQLRHNQVTCASELISMLLEAYTEKEVPAEGAKLDGIKTVLQLFQAVQGADAEDTVLELRRAAGAALKWCKKCGERAVMRDIHGTAGRSIVAIQGDAGLGVASLYFSLSNDMASFAAGVQSAAAHGKPGEARLFRTRALLQVLAVAQKPSMYTQLESARELYQLLSWEDTPLEHFANFLLVALGKLSTPLFDLLTDKYKVSINEDPDFPEMLWRIDSVFFGSGQAGGGLGGILGNLMGALTGDAE